MELIFLQGQALLEVMGSHCVAHCSWALQLIVAAAHSPCHGQAAGVHMSPLPSSKLSLSWFSISLAFVTCTSPVAQILLYFNVWQAGEIDNGEELFCRREGDSPSSSLEQLPAPAPHPCLISISHHTLRALP